MSQENVELIRAAIEAWNRGDWDEALKDAAAKDGVVVTRQKAHFVGRDGIELPGPTRSGWLWTIRDGKLAYVATYNDLDEALEAAGLAE